MKGRLLTPVLVATAAVLVSVGASSRPSTSEPKPWMTPIQTLVGPGTTYEDSGIVRWAKKTWLGTAIRGQTGLVTPTIYRWSGSRWQQQGLVRSVSFNSFVSDFSAANLTSSGAPDFVLAMTGGTAGSNWFGVISDSGGHWHAAPLGIGAEYGSAMWGYPKVRGNLLEAAVDSYGGAADYPTTLWIKYEAGDFVPTSPPGPRPDCSAAALNEAQPLLPRVRPFGRGTFWWSRALGWGPEWKPFIVTNFTCANGWAAATGSNGKWGLATYQQVGGTWRRVSETGGLNPSIPGNVAPTPTMAWEMELRIGLHHPRPGKRPPLFGVDRRLPPLHNRRLVRFPILPGSTFLSADQLTGVKKLGQRWRCSVCWFAAATVSHRNESRHPVLFRLYKRSSGPRWRLQSGLTASILSGPTNSAFPYDDITFLPNVDGGLPHISVGSFDMASSYGPGWLLYAADVGGHWRFVPFRSRYGHSLQSVSTGAGFTTAEGYPSRHVRAYYRLDNGAFVSSRYQTDPSCEDRILAKLPKHHIKAARAACGDGWALVVGSQLGRRVLASFSVSHGGWIHQGTSKLGHIVNGIDFYGPPNWLYQLLTRQLHLRSK